MNATCLILGIVFSFVGVVFLTGKGPDYIQAWKDTPEEEKKEICIVPLSRNVGSVILLSGVFLILGGCFSAFRERGLTWCMIAWLIMAGLDVYWIGKSGRYKKKEV